MKFKAKLLWDPRVYQLLRIPKRYLVFRPDPRYVRGFGTFLSHSIERHNQKARSEDQNCVPLQVTLERSERRSLDANALMWALYELEAAGMNADRQGPEAISKSTLYRQDMLAYAPTFTARIPGDGLAKLKRIVREDRIKTVLEDGGQLVVTVMETSSLWEPGKMALHIEMLFSRLAHMGLPQGRDLEGHGLWLQWRQDLNDRKVVLHTEMMSEEEYRDRQPSCEGCGKFIGDGSGQLAHISSRGSGVTWGEEKADPRNWLHLCGDCHVAAGSSQHKAGWGRFLREHEHLRFKVQEALRREV